jgi:3-hydroxypropanoate dehydrogenase
MTTLEQLFTEARTQNGYLDEPVPDSTLRELYEVLKWGPTSMNCTPARFAFVRTAPVRQQLAGCVSPGNADKILQAPVTVVIGMDLAFHDHLPRLFPHKDVRPMFADKPALIESTAFRNSSLQGAYLIIAARALGLGCGPMSGFDAAKVDALIWKDRPVRTNFLCALGRGDPSRVLGRSPRLAFDEACELL